MPIKPERQSEQPFPRPDAARPRQWRSRRAASSEFRQPAPSDRSRPTSQSLPPAVEDAAGFAPIDRPDRRIVAYALAMNASAARSADHVRAAAEARAQALAW